MWSHYMNHIAQGSLEVKLPNTDKCSNSCECCESSQGATVARAVREEKESVERRARCAKMKKSRKTLCFLQCVAKYFVALEGRKVGSPERQVRRHWAGWEIKNCTPLWHEAHFQVKIHPRVGALLEIALLKKRCAQLWHEAHFQVKMTKHLSFGALLEIALLKKCCAQLWHEARF